MITEQVLDKLESFSKEVNGHYSDRYHFSIIKRFKSWAFYHYNEINGSLYFIKYLKDMADLSNVYHAIIDKELK